MRFLLARKAVAVVSKRTSSHKQLKDCTCSTGSKLATLQPKLAKAITSRTQTQLRPT